VLCSVVGCCVWRAVLHLVPGTDCGDLGGLQGPAIVPDVSPQQHELVGNDGLALLSPSACSGCTLG
jgi:hypothetical protein